MRIGLASDPISPPPPTPLTSSAIVLAVSRLSSEARTIPLPAAERHTRPLALRVDVQRPDAARQDHAIVGALSDEGDAPVRRNAGLGRWRAATTNGGWLLLAFELVEAVVDVVLDLHVLEEGRSDQADREHHATDDR